MGRLLRWTGKFIAWACGVALAIVCAMWLRSYAADDMAEYAWDHNALGRAERRAGGWSSRGQVAVWSTRARIVGAPMGRFPRPAGVAGSLSHPSDQDSILDPVRACVRGGWAGFGRAGATESIDDELPGNVRAKWVVETTVVAAPYWALAAVLGVIPAVRIGRRVRRRCGGRLVRWPPRNVWRSARRTVWATVTAASVGLMVGGAGAWAVAQGVWLSLKDQDGYLRRGGSRALQVFGGMDISLFRDRLWIEYGAPVSPPAAPWEAWDADLSCDIYGPEVSDESRSMLGTTGNWDWKLRRWGLAVGVRRVLHEFRPERGLLVGLSIPRDPDESLVLEEAPVDPPLGEVGPPRPLPAVRVRGGIVLVPYWMIIAAGAVLPACRLTVRAWGWRRRRWVREGRCAACGYDLRATPGRCPECGRATSPEGAATQ